MDDEIEQISLSDLIHILVKRKKLIAITIAVFLILALVQTYIISSTRYASEVLLEINNIEVEPTKRPIEKESTVFNILESITHARDMDFNSYLNEVTSEDVIVKTIKDLKLEEDYSVQTIKSALSVSADEEAKTIKLTYVSEDPSQGKKIIETLAENFKEHITKKSQENSLETLEIIKKQMGMEKEKHAEALKEYEEASKGTKSSYELELELEALYEQITIYKTDLNDLNIQKDSINGALETATNSNNDGIIVRPGGGEEGGYIFLNTSRQALQVNLAETNARISSTKKYIEKLQASIEATKVEYQDIEFDEGIIRQKVELTKESYEVFAMKYQELNMQSSIDVGGISINIVGDTLPSSNPIGTRKVIKIGIFLMLGIMTGIILSFIVEYADLMKSKNKKRLS